MAVDTSFRQSFDQLISIKVFMLGKHDIQQYPSLLGVAHTATLQKVLKSLLWGQRNGNWFEFVR